MEGKGFPLVLIFFFKISSYLQLWRQDCGVQARPFAAARIATQIDVCELFHDIKFILAPIYIHLINKLFMRGKIKLKICVYNISITLS